MAGTRYYFPPRAQSVALALLPGATLTFYRSGTLNLQAVFADRERKIPLNALRADSAGRFAELHLDPALTYRAILTSDGVTMWDLNPLSPFPGSDTNIPLDDGGAAIPSAVLTYWLSRTTVLAPIYADAGMTTPLANPLVADANGVFPSVFYNSAIEYRHRLEDGSRRLIFDHDPIMPVAPAAVFGTALRSSSPNGSDFTASAAWSWGSGDFTCEFWFKFVPGVDNTQFRVLRARSLGGAQSGWEVQVRTLGVPTTKMMRLLLRPSTTSFTFDSAALPVNDNVWAHYAFVVDQTAHTVEYFLNGVSQGTTSTATGAGASGTAGGKSIMHAISGEVDELRVWTGKRSAAQILANYQVPFVFPLVAPTLVADFQFNEGSGATTADSVAGTVATIVTGGTFVPGPP